MKLKYLFLIFAAAVCFMTSAVSQNRDSSNQESEIILTENVQTENPERQFIITDTQNNINSVGSTSGVWIFFRMILVLALVVVCIYFVMNFMKKSMKGDGDTEDPYLRKVAQVTLAPGKTVQIVTVLDNCYVVGVSDSGVNLIGTIDDKELVSAMNISADKASKTKKARNFDEILEMFLPSKSSRETEATQQNIYSESTKSVNDFVKTQRKRLNKKREE